MTNQCSKIGSIVIGNVGCGKLRDMNVRSFALRNRPFGLRFGSGPESGNAAYQLQISTCFAALSFGERILRCINVTELILLRFCRSTRFGILLLSRIPEASQQRRCVVRLSLATRKIGLLVSLLMAFYGGVCLSFATAQSAPSDGSLLPFPATPMD